MFFTCMFICLAAEFWKIKWDNMDEIISVNPATLQEIGRVKITPEQKVKEYISKAKAAFPLWSRISIEDRARYLLRAREYLLDHIDDFALTITRDNGKPLTESLSAEIYPIASLLWWAAHNTEKIFEPKNIGIGIFNLMLRRSHIEYQPLGVVGIISPWNYPFSIPAGTIAMALVAGNCVIFKPSSATPIVGQKIEEMFNAIGLPEAVFTHVPGDSSVGEAIISSSVDKVVFTGSVEIGKHVAEVCARNLRPCVLELGGKDAVIIRADANLEHASSGVVWGAFTNAGQCCASIERVYVQRSIADKFIDMVVEKTKKLRVGNGENIGTDIGPMTTLSQLQVVEAHVEEARKRGAKILTGGKTITPGYFYEPTVITGIDHSFSCVMEETFGPTLPIMTYEDDEDAVRLANDSQFGLNAYIWTGDMNIGKKMASKLRAGTVAINESVYTHALPETPWGGIKYSGSGRTHGEWGFYDLVNLHHVHINPVTFIKDFWWYPYNQKLFSLLKILTKTLTKGRSSIINSAFNLFRIFLQKKN